MKEALIYLGLGMLTLFLSVVQAIRQGQAGQPIADESVGPVLTAAFFLWPLVLPIAVAYLWLWKPSVKAGV
ncbi:hypothetical protein [Brevundimonas sp. NPDC058933]|uniref:hypothetical protein n=1 Tax=Brevundimonas sp. NPDC058933 TaxID=3346673 RepID=UPI003BEEB265